MTWNPPHPTRELCVVVVHKVGILMNLFFWHIGHYLESDLTFENLNLFEGKI